MEGLKKIYTGDEITVSRIKQELEQVGITTLVKDGYNQGLAAGFVGGTPSAIDVYVLEENFEKASEVLKDII